MENSTNLGYTTHVLSTIKSVTECKKILVYNRNSFIDNEHYSRLTLYNLNDIYNNVLVDENSITGYNENCCPIDRVDIDEEDITNNPFQYNCNNVNTPNGFNIIIYLNYVDEFLVPVGFTEFVNTQGRISERIDIYLKFNIKGIELELHLLNSLYGIRNTLSKNFIGTELNEYTSNFVIDEDVKKRILKDSKYVTHLSAYINEDGKNNIYLNDRFLNSDKTLVKLDLIDNFDFGLYNPFEKRQLTYYRDDIVVYSWKIVNNQIKYQIVSAIDGQTYIENNDIYGVIDYIDSGVLSQEVNYCAGKYMVIKVNYRNGTTKIKLFDTENKNWVETIENNIIVDPFDKEAEIIELPKSESIQDLDTAYFLFPDLINIYLDLKEYMNRSNSLDVVRKIGDWIIIRNRDNNRVFYIATNMFSSIYMTDDDYNNMIVINDSTLLLNEEKNVSLGLERGYYTVYYGVRNKTYYTERARSRKTGIGLTVGDNGYLICNDSEAESYIETYNKKEVEIVFKDSRLINSIFNQFRRKPLKKLTVPSNIVSAIGGIIYYKENNNNNLSYI